MNNGRKTNWILALAASILMLSACTADDIDKEPSTTDNSVWALADNMDTLNYRPGDDFFMFCNGGFWNRTSLANGANHVSFIEDEMTGAIRELMAKTDFAAKNKFEKLLNAPGALDMSDEDIDKEMASIKQTIDQLETREDCYRMMARMYKMGYDKILTTDIKLINDTIRIQLEPRVYYASVGATKEDGKKVLAIIADEIGIPLAHVSISNTGLKRYSTYTTTSVEKLKDYLWEVAWCQDKPFMNNKYLADAHYWLDKEKRSPGETFDKWVEEIQNHLKYTSSHDFATTWVSPQLKEDVLSRCEELRNVFRQRITKLDWMSATTKDAALRKLDQMTFNAGYPDQWIGEGLADLSTCTKLIDAVRKVREADTKLMLALVGTSFQDNVFNTYLYIGQNNSDITETTAYYVPSANSIVIYPSFMLPPAYDSQSHDAINYATCYVLAHEMTHGFDSNGSKYDEKGHLNNWWTVQDKMNFEERYALLVNCYNHLEMLPWDATYAGVYCPGERTLGENIADLGGFEIAKQAYLEKCMREGYYGEELDKQEKKFYQAFANIWRSKYNGQRLKYIVYDVEDPHALERERVNGVVMNTDRWYELYNVERGNKLYLEPERRTSIW